MRKLTFGLVFLIGYLALSAQEGRPGALPEEVNSGYDEWSPVISPEGKTLYFTRLGHPQNMGDADAADIWATYRYADGHWSGAVNAGAPLNSRGNDQVVGVHVSGRRIYLYRPDTHTLYYSDRQGRVWQPPMPLMIDSFSLEGRNAHFAFSPEGETLLLSFAGPGSMGGRDIYLSTVKKNGRYTQPKPLGPPVNSSADEAGLWLAADGETLYFSSGRPGGHGGQDLYFSRRLDGGWEYWTLPRNLGPVINTSEDDLFLSLPASGSPIYLLRQSENGSFDIFEATLPDSLLPEPLVLLTGTVRDAASGQVVSRAEAQVYPAEGRPPVSNAGPACQDGVFQFVLPLGQDFQLSGKMDGYFPVSNPVELSGKPLKEADQDNPLLLASLNRDPAYIHRNEEIIGLQLHLRKLDEELIQLQEKREALRQEQAVQRREAPEWRPPSDPESEALRHRYQQYARTSRDTIIPDAYEAPASSPGELEDMKERYLRYVQHQKKQQRQAEAAAQGSPYLWDEAEGFEYMQEEVRQGLEAGLAPKIKQELRASMLDSVKREVADSLNDERERRQLELKEDKLRQEIQQSFGNSAGRPENWSAKGGQPETEWERQLKEDIRKAMEPGVQAELRQQMKDDIRAALSNDITYWAKKETRTELQEELNQKLHLQVEQERRKALSVPAGSDAVAPLEPASDIPAGYREINRDLLLIRVEAGSIIPLNSVVFEANKPTLKPMAYAELGRVLEFLNQNEGAVVEIGVHVGQQLSHSSALALTTQRAQAIVNYLIGHGVDAARAIPKGYGKALPPGKDGSPQGQNRDQRVEMRIISIAD
ncbi:MAG: OmpA family protein [Lewinellaceae bacterium]|nr:OmpA family protein [Lewinellaceae bacterium]